MRIETKIKNSRLVTDMFGYWPSFHDAEVLELSLRRERSVGDRLPTLAASVLVFEMTSVVDERGRYKLKNKSEVRLRFDDLVQVELDGFNHQNVLSGLHITEPSGDLVGGGKYQVVFDSAYGVELSFQCAAIEVESVIPWQD